jgi:hypothetical protein
LIMRAGKWIAIGFLALAALRFLYGNGVLR